MSNRPKDLYQYTLEHVDTFALNHVIIKYSVTECNVNSERISQIWQLINTAMHGLSWYSIPLDCVAAYLSPVEVEDLDQRLLTLSYYTVDPSVL